MRVLAFRGRGVRVSAGQSRANVVNYFIRKANGKHTEEFPQRSATSGMGGSFAWGADAQPGSDPQVRKPGGRKAQNAAQDSLHRQRQWLRPRRAGSGKGAGEGGLGLVWRYLHGRGHCRSPERSAKADPGADEFRAGGRITAGGARPDGGDSSLRANGVTQSRGGAARRQEAGALPFENRYGDEPAGHRYRRRGVLRTATGEVQAPTAYRDLFAFCFIGSFHEYRGWPADARTRREILRRARAAARAGDRSGHCAPGEQASDRDPAGDVGGNGAARRDSLWLPSGI